MKRSGTCLICRYEGGGLCTPASADSIITSIHARMLTHLAALQIAGLPKREGAPSGPVISVHLL